MTDVRFLIHPEDGNDDTDVYALFPSEYQDVDKKYFMCYSHVGQHGGVHPLYVSLSYEASPVEYKDLMEELISIGYDLNILNKFK